MGEGVEGSEGQGSGGPVLREPSLMGWAALLFVLKANLKAVQWFCLFTPPLTLLREAACGPPVFPDYHSKCFALSGE